MSVLEILLSRESALLQRPAGGVDAEGTPLTGFVDVGRVQGTWGSASATDLDVAARAELRLDAVMAGTFDADIGWRLIGLRGENWEITSWSPTHTHRRYFLRRVT